MGETAERLVALGYQARRECRLNDGKQFFAEAAALSRVGVNETLLAKAVTGSGQIERDLQNTEAALAHYREAEHIYRRLADPSLLAHTLRHIGDILRGVNRLEQARPYFEEALAIYRERRDTPALELANTLRGFALLNEAAGQKNQACAFWREARTLYEAAGVAAGARESEQHLRED